MHVRNRSKHDRNRDIRFFFGTADTAINQDAMFSDKWGTEQTMQSAFLVLLGLVIGCLIDRWCIQRILQWREQGREERQEPRTSPQRAPPVAPAQGEAIVRRDAGPLTRRRIPSTGPAEVLSQSASAGVETSPPPQERVPQPAPARGRTIANQDAGTSMSPLTSPPKAVTWQDDGVSIARRIDDDEALCS